MACGHASIHCGVDGYRENEMNLIDLFIKRRKKVERLTKALAEARRQLEEDEINSKYYSFWNDAVSSCAAYQGIYKKYFDKYHELEDKYTTLKAIVLAIDDERIKEAVKE